MTTFRDWPRTLRPASYRGVGFYVEADTIETGRRIEVHEFPHADAPYVEDLGRRANTISVTAYVLSDSADSEEKALRRACDAGGPAMLSLPMERLLAHCETCARDFERDRMGYVAFNLEFVRDGLATGGMFPIGFLSSLVTTLIGQLLTPVSAAFATSYNGLRVPGFVTDAATSELRTVAALADTVARTAPIGIARVPGLLRQAADLYDTAPLLVQSGAAGERIEPTVLVAAGKSVDTSPLVKAVWSLVTNLVTDLPRDEAIRALEPFLAFNAELPVAGSSPSSQRLAANSAAIGAVVRIAAVAALAERAVSTTYDDRREAIQMRADMAEIAGFELERLTGWRDHQIFAGVTDLSGRVASFLSAKITDLAPVNIVEAPLAMPSLWWANRLYGDAGRAAELVARNGVIHAAFMPLSFEALAK